MSWLDRLGLGGLWIFALACVYKTAPGHYGLALALPAALIALARQRPDAVTWLVAALALWLSLRLGLQQTGVGTAGLLDPVGGYVDWLFPLLFLPMAAFTQRGGLPRLAGLWLLALLGLLTGVLAFLAGHGWTTLWSGARLGFHLERPLGVGLYAGTFLLVLVATGRLWWSAPAPWRWPARGLGLALVALLLQVVLSAQNRSTFLALPVALLAMGAAWLVSQGRLRVSRGGVAAAAALAVLGAALVAVNLETLRQRVGAERETWSALREGELEAAPITSITIRLHLWRSALAQAVEAPLIGHGFGGIHGIAGEDPSGRRATETAGRYDHFHNSYIQLLWSQGLIGTGLWAALGLALLGDLRHSARHAPPVRALLPAVAATLAFVGVWAVFAYRLPHPDMRFFTLLLLLSLRVLGREGAQRP